MKKLMVAIAGAVALTCSAFAEATSWFNGGVAADFPTDATMFGGSWSNVDEQAAWTGSAVEIEADDETPLAFNATVAKALGDETKSVTISSTVKFTPFETVPEVPAGAKAGVIAMKDEGDLTYYVLAKDGDANVWTDTGIAAADASVAVTVKMTKEGEATYTIGNADPVTVDIFVSGTISAVNYTGDGEITSLTAEYEANIVTFTVPEATGATITSVTVDGEVVTAPYAGKPGAELVVTYKANDGYLFGNKTDTFVYEGEVAAGAIPTGVEDQGLKLAPAKIGTQLYYTLQEAFDAAKADETVALCTATDESVIYAGDKTFTLDMDGKAWTVTGDAIALKVDNADADITIKGNGSITVAKGFCVWTRQGEVTIENGTFTNDDNDNYAIYAGGGTAPNFLASKVTIKGGDFVNLNGEPYVWQSQLKNLNLNVQNNNPDAIIEVSGGTFTAEPKDDSGVNFVAEGCVAKKVGNVWTVGTAAAEVGGVLYLTLQEAFDAAKTDETVKLLTAVAESVIYTGDKTFTLDQNGQAWAVTGDAIALKVDNADADITITNGNITVAKGFCVWTRQGEVTIENGTFTNDDNDNYAIYAGGGTAPNFLASKVTIKGGDFVNLNGEPYVWQSQLKNLNLNVQNNNPDAIIEVSGGTFTAEPKDDSGVNFVKEGYYAVKSGSKWVVTDSPAAKIGTTYYLTFSGAFDAAKDGDTITLCKNVSSAKILIPESKFATGITFDLDGFTLTFNSGIDDAIQALKGNNVTIKDGTVTTAKSTVFRDIIRFYSTADKTLALDNVVLDGANISTESTAKVESVLTIEGGTCTITGGSITSPAGVEANTFYAIKLGNHANATLYSVGTLTVNGAVTGDILLTGGTYVEGDNAAVTGNYYYGKNAYSSWDDANNTVFAARTGDLPETGKEDNVAGQLFKTLDAAVAGVAEDGKVSLLDAVTVNALTVATDCTIDINGQYFTANGAVALNADVKMVNSKQAGLFAPNGVVTIAADKVLDLSEMPFGTTYYGIEGTGSITITSGAEAKFYKWNVPMVDSANWMFANMPAFFTGSVVPVGGKVTIGDKTWTGTANGFEVEGTVAFAQIDAMGNIGGVQTPIVVNECYTTLDAAIKAVKVGGTVKLVTDVAEEIVYTGDKTFTLDQNGQAWAVTGDAIALKVDNADADITITNGNITVEKGFCVWARQGEVTIENGTFTNDDNDNYAIYAGGGTAPNFLASKVTIKGGDFVNLNGEPYVWQSQLKNLNLNVQNNNPLASITVYGGTYTAEPKDDTGINFVAEGYFAQKVGNVWTVYSEDEAAAKIGTQFYITLADAAAAAKDGDTVTLVKDVSAGEVVFADKNADVTLDLNGKTISATDEWDCIEMGLKGDDENVGTGTLTITGNGSIVQDSDNTSETCEVVWARWGNVVISNGYYEVNGSFQCVYSTMGSQVKIYGGTFKNVTTGTEWNYGDVLNVDNKTGATTDIQCFGGSYSKDPSLGDDAMGGTFVAPGYASYKQGDLWTVAAAMPKATVAENSLAAALGGLDAAYTFTAEGTCPAQPVASKNVDYVVTFDKDVEAGAIRLAAVMESGWTNFPAMKFTAGTPYPLIASMEKTVSVAEMYAMGSFTCGISNINVTTETKMTVQLVMADTVPYVITNVTYTITPKVEPGPYTPPTGGGTVEPTEIPGVYEVTPDPSSGIVTIAGGLSETDTIIVTITNDFTIVGVPEDQIKIILNDIVVPNTAFMGGDENGFSTALDPDGYAGEVSVTPTLIEETPTEKPFVVGDSVETTVQAIPGLTYKLMRGDEPGAYPTQADKQSAGEEAETITLQDADKPADKAFYVIEVTK